MACTHTTPRLNATALHKLRYYSNDAHVMDIQLNHDLIALNLSTFRCQREMRRNKLDTVLSDHDSRDSARRKSGPLDAPADTITTHLNEKWGCWCDEQQRLYTARECARFHSFPDEFSLGESPADMQRHVGNMVPPLVAKAIGLSIMTIINS